MSDIPTVEKNDCLTHPVACCAWATVLALVFLRLCVGWHFFSEGIKKVEYDGSRGEFKMVFSSEGFLNGAKGPLAEFFQNQAPTTHHWRQAIVIPRQLDPKANAKLSGWVAGYVKRRQGELKTGKATEPQFAEFSPAAAWGENIRKDWEARKNRLVAIKDLSDEWRKQAEAVYKKYEIYLADYLAEESLAIETYQHELWRLEQAKSIPGSTEVPFEISRVADQQVAVDQTPRKWVAQVKSLDADFTDELTSLLTVAEQGSPLGESVESAVTNPELHRLARTDLIVTCVVIGVGVCLLLGLFTRVAAIAGALFLLSVMATQPPWVPGAMSPVPYYYQLVEFAACLFLAAVGAGRWAGLDFIIHELWSRRRSA